MDPITQCALDSLPDTTTRNAVANAVGELVQHTWDVEEWVEALGQLQCLARRVGDRVRSRPVLWARCLHSAVWLMLNVPPTDLDDELDRLAVKYRAAV